ncbi:MAG: ATP-grasp domain-containing protein [Candidatus Protochlamydia sp.]|nr:ATP-grasp domain-containing protein [Candidatus Protochlamydia sp.]
MQKRVLITSGRSPVALDLARQLKSAGHVVFIAETLNFHVCRFSNAVSKSFIVRSPRLNTEGFIEDITRIIEEEEIDLLIPIYEEALYLSYHQDRFPPRCKLFVSDFPVMNDLHNKWLFNQKLIEQGFHAPQTVLLEKIEDLKKLDQTKTYAVKAVYSRAGLQIKKFSPSIDKNLNIKFEPGNPWIAQEWIEGEKYCTYSVCQVGKVLAHSTYPVGYAVDGKGCIVFTSVDHNRILAWVQRLVKSLNYTGQIAFDLIEKSNHKIYAIECNPRATSGAHLFLPKDRLDRAFLNTTSALIRPKNGTKKQLAVAMMLFGWRKNAIENNSSLKFLKTLTSVRDVVFSAGDLLPIVVQPAVFVGIWLRSVKAKQNLLAYFMYDYEWNGSLNENEKNQEKEEMLCLNG